MVRSARLRRLPATLASLMLAAASPACRDDLPPTEEPPPEPDIVRSPYLARVQDELEQLLLLVRAQPDNADLRVAVGKKFLEGWMPALGERHLSIALRLDPRHVEARELLARSALERQETDEAVRLLEEGLRLQESAPLLALLGRIELERAGADAAAARAPLDRALELDPRHVEAAYDRARLAAQEGDGSLAISLLERVVALRPNHLGATFNLARQVRTAGDDARAEVLLATHRRLAALDDLGRLDAPDSVEASIALGEMWIEGGAVEEGLAELRAGVERHPKEPLARVRLALALDREGEAEAAVQEFERALREIPRDVMILNQYAWFLATHGDTPEQREKALRLAEKAVKLTGGADANVLDTLAEARAATGDAAGALAAIRQAVRLRPGDVDLERRERRFAKANGEAR